MILDRSLRLLFFAALAITLFMALNPSPPAVIIDVWGDKAQHMLAFGSMALLARLGFPRAPNWLILERLSFIGALIEVFQAIPSLHRDCDWKDWAADTIAAGLALLLVAPLRLWLAGRRAPRSTVGSTGSNGGSEDFG